MDKQVLIETMKKFDIPFMNTAGELIIDVKKNIYCSTEGLETASQLEASIVMSMTRPIYKGLSNKKAEQWLDRLNRIYGTMLTRDDMGKVYQELCYWRLIPAMEKFIKDGFPVEKAEEYARLY